MTPVFTFVAYSGTGKTTYIEKLIKELTVRGLRVGAVKHDAHEFEIDKPGKDSWRFAQAGAQAVAISSATKSAVMEYRPLGYSEIIGRMRDVDIIICEGWHTEGENRILLWRSTSGSEMKLDPAGCIAVVSDAEPDTRGTPLFPLDDPAPMADFLQERIKN